MPTIIDVTLRDGGYVHDHSYSLADACTIIQLAEAAGFQYCEIGYFRPREWSTLGHRKPVFCCPPSSGLRLGLHNCFCEFRLLRT